jgi:hypothetical protein
MSLLRRLMRWLWSLAANMAGDEWVSVDIEFSERPEKRDD